jgi:PAS domain S-box-containing protein
MSTHILALLYRLDAGGECGFSDRVIGREDVYYRQISRELLYSKKHAEVILNHLAEGVLELTLCGEIVYANPTAVRILDTPEEVLLGTPLQDLFEGNQRDRVVSLVEQVGTGSDAALGEWLFDIKGRQIWLDMIYIEDEAHRAVTVIMNDLSRQKRDADAIAEQEEKYRSLVENLHEVVFEADATGLLTYVNPAIEAFSGYTPEEIVGRHFKKLLHRKDARTAEKRLRRILDGGIVSPFEYRLVGKDGHVRWVRVMGTVYSEAGKPKGIRGLATDTTRFLELQQERVFSDWDAGPVSPGAAFDSEISAPLSSIDSAVRSMEKRCGGDAGLRSELKVIQGACHNLREAANRLHGANRPGRARSRATGINRVIEETVARLKRRPDAAKADVILALLPDLPEGLACSDPVRLVLTNVICSMIGTLSGDFDAKDGSDRTEDGGTLTIRTGTESGHVYIGFSDNGSGIAEGDLQEMLDPLYARKARMGIGAGFARCRAIIEDNGGTMTAENRPEGGMNITILLPIP